MSRTELLRTNLNILNTEMHLEMSTVYRYEELQNPRIEIRLVTIRHELDSCILSCSLITCQLDNMAEYKALSYVWGDSSHKHKIQCNGVDLFVTSNLLAAMLQLRQETPATFWVDAICINQNSISERNHQVPLMTRIYAQVTHVLIWLGGARRKHRSCPSTSAGFGRHFNGISRQYQGCRYGYIQAAIFRYRLDIIMRRIHPPLVHPSIDMAGSCTQCQG
jgi:hypothetical protein